MQELWINDKEDFKEFKTFLEDESIEPTLLGVYGGGRILQAGDFKVHVPDEYDLDIKDKDSSESKYDRLIFGKDDTENITNITIEDGVAHIYRKDAEPLRIPYNMWAVGSTWTEGSHKLKGHQYYKYMKDITMDEYHRLRQSWNPRVWMPRTPEEGFMLKLGYTQYKGMKVSDVSVLSFDIEATGFNPDDPNAEAILISNTYRDRNGKIVKKLFDIHDYQDANNPEGMMIGHWVKWVNEIDPDIMIGHNIFSYDLPYLNTRAGFMSLGRDGSELKFDDKTWRFRKDGSQQIEYNNAYIHGRDVIDTMFLSIKYDIGRDFPSYGLKQIEQHLRLVDDDRVDWDFDAFPTRDYKNWPEGKWEEFRQYCIDDGDSPLKMFDIMIPAFFYLTQSVPKTLQQVINEASGSQLDTLMIRSYLQDGNSIPRTSQTKQYKGAISMGVPGIYENVLKFDVASLYPSIMLEYNIYDKKKDPNRHMLKMLSYFRDERLENKYLAKITGKQYYDDMQQAQKIVINSMYGFLGANFLLFNFPDGAEAVTRHGREINLKGIEWATGYTLVEEVKEIKNKGKENEETKYHWVIGNKVGEGQGYELVNTDTDSFSITNGLFHGEEDFNRMLKDLNNQFSDMIVWEDDGQFDQVIVIKAKNYVLVKDGKVKYKGSSLTDQKKEPILRGFLTEVIDLLLNGKQDCVADSYKQFCQAALDIKDIKQWLTKKTVTDAMIGETTAAGAKAHDACKEAIAKSIIPAIQEQDKIWVYQYIRGQKQKVVKGEPQVYKKTGEPVMVDDTALRFGQLFDGNYDKWHYVKRVWATLEILESVIDLKKFDKYHLKSKRKLLE